jgi:hypothetical protein
MSRKYSDAFVQKKVDQIDELKEKTDNEYVDLPDALYRDEYSWMRKQIIAYVNNRANRSYIQGFWYGWTLKSGDPTQE